jgi:hypothetical protein
VLAARVRGGREQARPASNYIGMHRLNLTLKGRHLTLKRQRPIIQRVAVLNCVLARHIVLSASPLCGGSGPSRICIASETARWAGQERARSRTRQSAANPASHIFNAARPNVSGRRRSRWGDRDATGGEASGKQSSVLAAPTEEGAPARAVGVVPLECVKSFAVARAKANVNPPASVPQIAGTDT